MTETNPHTFARNSRWLTIAAALAFAMTAPAQYTTKWDERPPTNLRAQILLPGNVPVQQTRLGDLTYWTGQTRSFGTTTWASISCDYQFQPKGLPRATISETANSVTSSFLGFPVPSTAAVEGYGRLGPHETILIINAPSPAAAYLRIDVNALATVSGSSAEATYVVEVDIGSNGTVDYTFRTGPKFPAGSTSTSTSAVLQMQLNRGDNYIRTATYVWTWAGGTSEKSKAKMKGSLTLEVVEARAAMLSTLGGNQAGAYLGWSVAGIGDVDGDGCEDTAVGSPFENRGVVTVVSGKTGAPLYRVDGASLGGRRFGYSVAGAGDTNGDGVPDLIVGDPGQVFGAWAGGAIWILSGRDGSVLWNHSSAASWAQTGLGASVAGAGDVNGDGYDDVIAGAPDEGRLAGGVPYGEFYVYSGRDGSLLGVGGATPSMAQSTGRGWAVAGAGDIDQDGMDDLLVGVPGGNVAGKTCGFVHVVSGRDFSVIRQIDGYEDNEAFGMSVASVPDLDGDGRREILVGAPRYFGAKGAARLYSGATGRIMAHLKGLAAGDNFGASLSVGDLDGDTLADLVIGAPGSDTRLPRGSKLGYVRVFSGATLSELFPLPAAAAGNSFGYAVATADVDGDGRAEVVVGMPRDGTAGINAGRTEIYDLPTGGDPGRFVTYGAGCPGSAGHLPRIGIVGHPTLGSSFAINLRAAPQSQVGVLRLTGGRAAINLSPIGMPGCTLLTNLGAHYADLIVKTDPFGRAAFTLQMPQSPSLVGLKFNFQWWIKDVPANTLGWVITPGGEMTVGGG